MRRDLTGEICKLIDKRTQQTKRTGKRVATKIVDNTIELYFDPADQKLLLNKLKDASVSTAALQDLAVDTSKLANLSVEAAKLANSAVTSTKIANAAVGSAAIANLAVGNAHIQTGAILEANIGNLAVTNAKIADASVNNAKISDLSASKINAGAIATNNWVSSGSGTGYQLLYKQIHQFVESGGLVKMAMGFVADPSSGWSIPGIVLGAGAGNDASYNKGYISKDANGLNLYYVNTANQAHGISIQADGIHITDDLILDNTLAQAYVTQSGWLSNLTQKLNSSGNFGVNQSGKRVEITDMLVTKNTSGQNHGLYVNPTYSDMILYYNGSEHVKFYNNLDNTTSLYIQGHSIGWGSTTTFYMNSNWDVSNCTFIGTKKIHVDTSAPSDTSGQTLWLDIN